MRTADEHPRHRANHLQRDGRCNRDWRWLLQGSRLCRLAWTGPTANLNWGSYDPGQDIEARQSLPACPVRAGSMGRACESEADQMGRPRAQALDRGCQEAVASQRVGDCPCQQARAYRVERSCRGRAFEASKLQAA